MLHIDIFNEYVPRYVSCYERIHNNAPNIFSHHNTFYHSFVTLLIACEINYNHTIQQMQTKADDIVRVTLK